MGTTFTKTAQTWASTAASCSEGTESATLRKRIIAWGYRRIHSELTKLGFYKPRRFASCFVAMTPAPPPGETCKRGPVSTLSFSRVNGEFELKQGLKAPLLPRSESRSENAYRRELT